MATFTFIEEMVKRLNSSISVPYYLICLKPHLTGFSTHSLRHEMCLKNKTSEPRGKIFFVRNIDAVLKESKPSIQKIYKESGTSD